MNNLYTAGFAQNKQDDKLTNTFILTVCLLISPQLKSLPD